MIINLYDRKHIKLRDKFGRIWEFYNIDFISYERDLLKEVYE